MDMKLLWDEVVECDARHERRGRSIDGPLTGADHFTTDG
jgi:hypothetical protein